MVNNSYHKMKEEEGRRIAVVDAFHVAEKSNNKLKIKLQEEEKERKSVTTALDTWRGKPRARGCFCVTPRTNWLPSRSKLSP